jgi:hypothetical protein
MTNSVDSSRIGAARVGASVLALGTAGIHLYLFLIEGFLGNSQMLPIYQLLFVGNFIIYVILALALLLSPLARVRSFVRAVLIAVAVASIVSYFHVGVLDALGNIDKTIEVLILVLATVDTATTEPGADLAGRFAGGAPGAVVQLIAGIAAGVLMYLVLTPFLV